ncbi:MAG: hypothetical protein WC514_00325 [Candidatus Paceibacterota bacterium]
MRRKTILFLVVAFVVIGVIGFWAWRSGTYSKEVLKLEILGPTEADLGQEVEYIVKYKNNGNFRLENPQLVFEPPSLSMKDEEIFRNQVLGVETLGEAIYPGEEKNISFKVRLLGKEGESKLVKATLSYQPKDLKAKYESSTTFTTTIKSAPLTFEFDLPSKINSGEDFRFRLNYFSNLDYSLSGIRIQLDYPSDFEFIESIPKSLEKTDWDIPVLNKGQGGRVEVAGRVSADAGEVKIFRAKMGIWKDGEFILLKEAEKGLEVVNPTIYLRQEINKNPQYSAVPGEWLHYEIYFKNIGDDSLNNLFMVTKLTGDAFDLQTIKSDVGNCQPGDNSVIFDWRKISKLQYLAPTDEGMVDFWVKVKDDLGSAKNPSLRDKVFISQIEQEFVTKVSSKMELVQKGYYQDEVFGNSGPVPPVVGEPTTYTIMWYVKNYYSDVKDVKVKAVLPEGVELTGKIFPEDASSKFAFDSQSREIVWSVGDIIKGEGVLASGRNIAFQISFTPTESQRGKAPNLINEVVITGEDSWTDNILQSTTPPLNTNVPDDTVSGGKGVVQ